MTGEEDLIREREQKIRSRRGSRLRFLNLVAFLLLLILLLPFFDYLGPGPLLLWTFNAAVLISGGYAVSDRTINAVISAAFAVSALSSGWMHLLFGIHLADAAASAFLAMFYGFTTIVILARVLRYRVVDRETIYGAISVYLLIGFTFATIYQLIERLSPGSFAFGGELLAGRENLFPQLVYYSFITLTTTGTGDFYPATDVVRSFAVLEAVIGTLYIAVLIARLIGIISAKPKPRR
ncbi:MAG: potassium channel family protein [Methanomicrobiaceae archaeon]|nr:potassium channel family protein [Methanomicrobiaceae archaeon]